MKGRWLNLLTTGPKQTPRVGLEPTTPRLTAECSTIELSRNKTSYFMNQKRNAYLTQAQSRFAIFKPAKAVLILLRRMRPPLSLRSIDLLCKSIPIRKSSRPISTPQLNMLPCLHSVPINVVVFNGSYKGISHLEVGFTLRCLQRLSVPDLATQLCTW